MYKKTYFFFENRKKWQRTHTSAILDPRVRYSKDDTWSQTKVEHIFLVAEPLVLEKSWHIMTELVRYRTHGENLKQNI